MPGMESGPASAEAEVVTPLRRTGCLRAWPRQLALLMVCVVLVGCGTLRIVYGQGAMLSYWWLDRYVDFNGLQTPKVHQALGRWFAWQHAEALPQALQLLASVQTDAARTEVSAQRICGWWAEALSLRDDAYRAALPALGELARTLTPAQLTHIEARQAKSNEDYREEFLQPDLKDRLEASVERAEERLKLLYGSLDRRQSQQVARWIGNSPFDAERWGQERQRRQMELMRTLRDIEARQLPPPAAQDALAGWWASAVHPRAPDYQAYVSALESDNCRFLSEFHRGSSAAQKQHLQDRLSGWAEDLRPFTVAP